MTRNLVTRIRSSIIASLPNRREFRCPSSMILNLKPNEEIIIQVRRGKDFETNIGFARTGFLTEIRMEHGLNINFFWSIRNIEGMIAPDIIE